MAALAHALTRFQLCRHPGGELSLVRIPVAAFAGHVGEVILPVSSRGRVLLPVAILADHRRVRAFQRKRGILVLLQRECRRVEAFHLVAVFAPLGMRRAGELTAMGILMTILARLERRVIVGIETGCGVAFHASQSLVFPDQRIGRGLMAGLGEGRRLPSRVDVTGSAFTVIGAARKLPLVLVLMAIHAFFMRDRPSEVGILVAPLARQTLVLAAERELGLTVVEGAAGELHAMPVLGVVARFAARRECAVVRILVAARTRLEIEPLVLNHLGIRLRRLMTLGAFHILVLSGQGEMRGRVIELFDRLPVILIVACLAFGSQLTGVAILVAGQAGRVQSFEGVRQIVIHNEFSIGRGNVLGVMAVLAFQLSMLAGERISGLLVIEFFFRGVPLEDAEVLAVVFGVAAGAVGIALGAVHDVSMHAFVRLDQLEDLPVAVQALQLGFSRAEAMTACTL